MSLVVSIQVVFGFDNSYFNLISDEAFSPPSLSLEIKKHTKR